MHRIYFVPVPRMLHRARNLAPCVRVWSTRQRSTKVPWLHHGGGLCWVYAQQTASAHARRHYLIAHAFVASFLRATMYFYAWQSGIRARLKQVGIYAREEACFSLVGSAELQGAPTSFFDILSGAVADTGGKLVSCVWDSSRQLKHSVVATIHD